MQQLPVEKKVELVVPYLERARTCRSELADVNRAKIEHVVRAAGDRIKTAGDILDSPTSSSPTTNSPTTKKPYRNRCRNLAPSNCLPQYKEQLAAAESFDAASA